jgi:hypothetical protein
VDVRLLRLCAIHITPRLRSGMYKQQENEKGHTITTSHQRIDKAAVASLVTAVVGVIAWPVIGGWAALLAATMSLVFGTLALARIKRTGQTGRWAAVVGIGFGAVFYAILIAIVVWDLIDPLELHR